jgi:hypothetical protein
MQKLNYWDMTFEQALEKLKKASSPHSRIRRKGWETDTYVGLQIPDEHSKNTAVYFFKEEIIQPGHRLSREPWLASGLQAALVDWEFIDDITQKGDLK